MRVTRIRKFKKSGEITFVVSTKEAAELSHALALVCRSIPKCSYYELHRRGVLLGDQLYKKALRELW